MGLGSVYTIVYMCVNGCLPILRISENLVYLFEREISVHLARSLCSWDLWFLVFSDIVGHYKTIVEHVCVFRQDHQCIVRNSDLAEFGQKDLYPISGHIFCLIYF